MKIELNLEKGYCKVIKEPGDPRFSSSNWALAESTFLHHVKKGLIKLGYDVIKKRMWKDGNMVDDTQQWVRTRKWIGPDNTPGEFAVYNNSYAIYDAGMKFNEDGEVILSVLQ